MWRSRVKLAGYRHIVIHVDEAMHKSLVDLQLTLNLGLSQLIVVK